MLSKDILSFINSEAETLNMLAKRKDVILQEVFYKNNVKDHEHVSILKSYIENKGKVPNGWVSIDSIFQNAWASASSFKHISFQNEDEVRLLTPPDAIGFGVNERKYRIEPWGIREYYELSLLIDKKIPNNLIKGIIIGPRSGGSIDIMERYLKALPTVVQEIPITKSKCPLR